MKPFPVREGVPGFRFAGIASGIKKGRKRDLGLILGDRSCTAAGVFTQNRIQAAPVRLCKRHLAGGRARAVLANSGNANACTGRQGLTDAADSCAAAADHLKIPASLILPCSTGVIGVPLPKAKIVQALPALIQSASRRGLPDFADSILTTDTFAKTVALCDSVRGNTIKVCGIAKGAGMIMPNMATMLAFIVTNATIDAKLLLQTLGRNCEETFNRITVDGDMSTNDTVLLMASGDSDARISSRRSGAYVPFTALLREVMTRLSRMIVQDGEGATKMICVKVVNAKSAADAQKAARQVANSPLVKTAFFGEDFNWGRIMGALGSSGAVFNPDRVGIFFNDIPAVKKGQRVLENLTKLKRTVKKKAITVRIDLKAGTKGCEIITCDLTYDYIKINADYTT